MKRNTNSKAEAEKKNLKNITAVKPSFISVHHQEILKAVEVLRLKSHLEMERVALKYQSLVDTLRPKAI